MEIRKSSPEVSIKNLCRSLNMPRASFYRAVNPPPERPVSKRKALPWQLSSAEKQNVLTVMNSSYFCDQPPHQIYATLLDKGQYWCSIRTMYRILHGENQVRERRDVRSHKNAVKPELMAQRPNELWSWDITKLKGPAKWNYFYLYNILDVFSKETVGWMVAERETGELAKILIAETCRKQNIKPEQLTIHSDRGSPMKSRLVANLLSDLGVTKTQSRPYVSNDNPFSESAFKTLKYRPEFPKRFGCIQDARQFCETFFNWYNNEHKHSGIALFTPSDVHYGRVPAVAKIRQEALDRAFEKHPKRFRNKRPKVKLPETTVWINPPEKKKEEKPEKHLNQENKELYTNLNANLSQKT